VAAAFLTRLQTRKHVCSLVRPGQRRASLAQRASRTAARDPGLDCFARYAVGLGKSPIVET
jgi:hypothetical protein